MPQPPFNPHLICNTRQVVFGATANWVSNHNDEYAAWFHWASCLSIAIASHIDAQQQLESVKTNE